MSRLAAFALAGFAMAGASAFSPAAAQMSGLGPMSTPDGQKQNGKRRPEAPPPAAIPGSRADSSLLASPADRAMVDMPPNEAMFDAINRGDLNATKEAIGRGADIHGRNVLGLTPLELAVDLGRNDISFLLLSLRSGAGYNTSGPPRANAPAAAPTRADRQAERRAEQQAMRQQANGARAAARSEPRTPVPARTAHLFAGDGGNPVPQAGFLGFDSAR